MTTFFQFIILLFRPWTWRMAWRDSRRSRGKLLLYAGSIVLGIAALTAISSFGRQMEQAMGEQAKSLLGADLLLVSRDEPDAALDALLASLGGEQSREIAFASMVAFPGSGGTRLVQVRALEGGFPFYGKLQAVPDGAVAAYRAGEGALVEETLMEQFGAKVGESLTVGDVNLPIAGILKGVPGETVAMASIAPRVFVPLDLVRNSPLLGQGSLVSHKIYFRFPDEVDVELLVEERRAEMREFRLRFDTVEERQRNLGQGLEHLLRFLNLVGFVALLLGGVGVASGIHVHMKQKLGAVATLRCLGTSVPQAFAVYFAQAMAMGLFGATAGALLGIGAQWLLQASVADFLPVEMSATVSLAAVWNGIWIGFLICLVFALLPLLPIRRVPPLAALRSASGDSMPALRDPLVWLVYALAAGGLVAFGVAQNDRWQTGVGYAAGIGGAFAVLAGFAWLVARITRRVLPASWPFVWRQGFGNLYRPNNRTVLLMQSLGMGVFLVLTMYLVQASLLRELMPARTGNEGNTVLFDIQTEQRDGVLGVLEQQGLPLIEDAPMISMRLHSVKGETVEALRKRAERGGWALVREYRSTYRSELGPAEKLVAGSWHQRVDSLDEPIPISLEQDLAKRLEVSLGDELVFDVQGIEVACRVASLREVDWRRLSPNFFIVFPAGVIEQAPAVHAVVTRTGSPEEVGRLQRELIMRFPNVSAVDLSLILETIDGVLGKISQVIRFMALFTVGTGMLVLTGAIASGRRQRLQESILLRTLGATRGQIMKILTAEYALLGVLAACNGILLANLAYWVIGTRVFGLPFVFRPWPMLAAIVLVTGVTLLAGLLGNRRILNRPPLEVLRGEN